LVHAFCFENRGRATWRSSGRTAGPPGSCGGYGVEIAERVEYTDEEMAHAWGALTRDAYGWSIVLDARLIGHIGLHHVERYDDRAMLRIGFYDDRVLGMGYGTEAVLAVARYAFEELGFHRLSLRVLASNARAIRCYEKCGFKLEGRERESAKLRSGWADDLLMGLLAADLDEVLHRLGERPLALPAEALPA
jgi:RimJ/RimL family protein N-acetyltransferase